MSAPIYLDYAAATPMDERVLVAMQPYFTKKFYNPSALYLVAKVVQADVTRARQNISKIIGAKPNEIIFTAGGTEANNLAIKGVMDNFPGSNMIVSAVEHDSVLAPAAKYGAKTLAVNSEGIVDVSQLANLIDAKTVLVSIMYANNEIGSIQPIRTICEQVKKIRMQRQKSGNELPLYVHTDAAQAAAYLEMHVSSLGVDLMTVNGGKIYGPKQSGFLYVKTGTQLQAQVLGGGQERNYRSGTENVAGIVGLSEALQLVAGRKKAEAERLKKLQKKFVDELSKVVPKAHLNGSVKHRLVNNVHITIPGTDNERIMMELDERGIQAATGSACSASSDEPSHVLTAIGITDDDARSSLRFTMGINTTSQDIKRTVQALAEIRL